MIETILDLAKQYRWVVITLGIMVGVGVLFYVSATTSMGTLLLLPIYLLSVFMLVSGIMTGWIYWRNRKNRRGDVGEEPYQYE